MNPSAPLRVTCLVLRREDRVLLVQRPAHKDQALKWEFPGGKIDLGETADACIKREIREELGIEIELRGRLQAVDHRQAGRWIRLLPFLAVEQSGSLELHEHRDLRWLKLGEIAQLDLCAADLPIVARLQESELEASAWWR